MKTALLLAAATGILSFATSVNAGEPLTSPQGRELIKVRSGGRSAPVTQMVWVAKNKTSKVFASPRGSEMTVVRSGGRSAPSFSAVVGYRATGSDGITASPKRRQQLDEKEFKVAPLK